MKAAITSLTFTALLFAALSPLLAQDTVAVGVQTPLPPGEELPDRVADQLVAFYNSPGTFRFSGRTRIPADQRISGNVAIIGGPVDIAGQVNGDLVVLNGDVTLQAGSRVAGDLTVVGGIIIGTAEGEVSGIITTYTAVFRYRRTEEGIEYLGSGGAPSSVPTSKTIALPSWRMGSSEIFVSASAYNRVEALPISIGPRITTGGSNPLTFDALLIWRTVGGFEPQSGDLGWQIRLRQHLFGHRAVWLEGAYQNVVNPIENWKLTNLENSLTLFFFRRDYRDYYMREGWYGLVGWRHKSLFGSFEYRDERHETRNSRNVWTIFFRSLLLTLGIDTRNDPDRPLSGWYGVLTLEQAVGGSLSGEKPDFSRFLLDLRRYLRVSRSAMLGLRLTGGGPFGNSVTPAQRQHVIGGAGSLPGYSMLQFDCGARTSGDFGTVPGYGCQRFTLFQAEYKSSLDFHWHWDDRQDFDDMKGDIFTIDFNPAIVLFYDAGAAWSTGENYWDHLTKSDNWVADLGAGLDFGGLGFYFAYPLTGSGGLNFVLRLTARF
jgi:hypothetical protein